MFITVQELQDHRVNFDELFPPGHVDYLTEGIQQVAPLEVHGAAGLLAGEIEIRGQVSTTVEMPCARCLDPVLQPVERDFDLAYRSIRTMTRGDEFEVPRGEEELGFYRGDGVAVGGRGQGAGAAFTPHEEHLSQRLRGLCPQCGCNLNHSSCSCASRKIDPRWERLRR